MKRSQAVILAWAVVVSLCVAAAISLRPPDRRIRSQRAPAAGSLPAPSPSIRATAPRFSRDPEHLQKLWERVQDHQGLDPFAEAPLVSSDSPASPASSNLVITAIWRQDGKSLAVINGRIFPENSEFAPYRITRIRPHDAELTGLGGTIRLAISFPNRGAAEAPRAVTLTRTPRTGGHISTPASTP